MDLGNCAISYINNIKSLEMEKLNLEIPLSQPPPKNSVSLCQHFAMRFPGLSTSPLKKSQLQTNNTRSSSMGFSDLQVSCRLLPLQNSIW
jgi:hypothetical protein